MPFPLCKFEVIPRRLIRFISSLVVFYFLKLLDCFPFGGLFGMGKTEVQFPLGIESVLGF